MLGNCHLRSERWLFFEAISAWLLGDTARPVVLLDWTKVGDDLHALVAAVPIGGRALPVYVEAHRERYLGKRPCRTNVSIYRDRSRDPWLLATLIADLTAEQVVHAYALRMKIEETFRDAKNHRFGWSLRHVRCYSAHRLANLLLLTTLAIIVVTLLGFEAERRDLHRGYQANTVKQRVLSFFVLGLAVIRRRDHEPSLERHALAEMLTAFHEQLRAHALKFGPLQFVGIS